jgi:light-regulated signal transduction histidine kinase (bacteriophytochrome)
LLNSPAFGQADLSNCERELIHLAGSIQPHGALLVVREADFVIVQASANATAMLGVPVDALLGQPVSRLGRALADDLSRIAPLLQAEEIRPLRVRLGAETGEQVRGLRHGDYEGICHRLPQTGVILELEPLGSGATQVEVVAVERQALVGLVTDAVQRLGSASNQGVLCNAVVQIFRDLIGYDRVMVYKFDPDGHGQIVAEARHPRLETLLGHHYPASDIPQRARDLYLRNRVRVLVDVHYQPVPVVPRLQPDTGLELDMSLSYLRSMSPLHIQYLKNMGVNATLVVSLIRDNRLWGLVACHHDSPRNVR